MESKLLIWILVGMLLFTGVNAIMVNSSTEIYSFNITNPQANASNLSCDPAYVRFSANISNYIYIDHVTFTIQGYEYETQSAGNIFFYDYYKPHNNNDLNTTIDFTKIKIWDISGGIAQSFPEIHIPLVCVGCNYNISSGSCMSNDSKLIQYIGNGVPGCNNYNETQDCNYCSEDIQENIIQACNGSARIVDYTDNNYSSCCDITGLNSDCHINFLPYNETQTLNCSYEADDFSLQCDPAPIITDRIPCLINLNDNQEYACWSFVSQSNGTGSSGNYLQVNPDKTEYQGTILISKKAETREFFNISNGMGSIYYTSKSLVGDTEYLLGVKCIDADGNIKLAEQKIRPIYEPMNSVASRGVWARENMGAIIIIMLSIIVVGGIIISIGLTLSGKGWK